MSAMAQLAHLPEAQKCGGGNTLGDNLPPRKGGGRCLKASATLPSSG